MPRLLALYTVCYLALGTGEHLFAFKFDGDGVGAAGSRTINDNLVGADELIERTFVKFGHKAKPFLIFVIPNQVVDFLH